jgi:hypothetical protein
MELWNRTMRRWIRPGSKGIALIRREGNTPRLEYVFDIADTREVEGARKPALWELREEHHASVARALAQRFGPAEETDPALLLMEQARRAVEGIYQDYLPDLMYETEDSLLEGLTPKALEVQFRGLMTASVQYTVLLRCGIDPAGYIEEDDLRGITAYSTPMVLHHLGSAVSTVSMELLGEIGRAVRTAERNISAQPLAKEPVIGYTESRDEFNDLKYKITERSNEDGAELYEGGRLPAAQPDAGRGGRDGGSATGPVREAAGALSEGGAQRAVHLHAADREAGPASEGNRPAGAGASGADRQQPDEAGGRGRSDESTRSNGLGAGGKRLPGTGGGAGAGGDYLQVDEQQETAGAQPAVSVSEPLFSFTLFPSVEEQVENIAQASSEEQAVQQQISLSEGKAPEEIVGRALTSGGNVPHSMERIVAFFQKEPTGSEAASFMKKEFGEGGKGVVIDGQEYALWFSQEGFRLAPGRSAFGPGSTLVPWVTAAAQATQLLQDGAFAAQEQIEAARGNEFRELAEALWHLRRDFSDEAKHERLLPSLETAYTTLTFPEGIKAIAELLEKALTRQDIMREMAVFTDRYAADPSLLRFRQRIPPRELFERIYHLFRPIVTFHASEDFIPVRARFITSEEIDQLLRHGSGMAGGKLRIAAYFSQAHMTKERVQFLAKEYGIGGRSYTGFSESHDGKGIQFTRADAYSGA